MTPEERDKLIEQFGSDAVIRLEEIEAGAGPEAMQAEIARLSAQTQAQVPVAQIPRKKAELVAHGEHGYIVPRTMEEAYRYAVAVVDAGLAPDSYKDNYSDKVANPQKVMLGIAAALEAGLPPMYGLRQIAIIQNRPTIWGDAAIALVQSHNLLSNQKVERIGTVPKDGNLADWPEDYGFCVSLSRRGQPDPYVGTFTVGQAKRAKLWLNTRKTPWIEHPERMLFNRARAWAIRDGFADALAGLAIREEVEDMTDDMRAPADTAFLDDKSPESARV